MKKIIPILAIASTGILLIGCNNDMSTSNNYDIKNNINSFKESLTDYINIGDDERLTKTALNKYNLTIDTPDIEDINDSNVDTDNMTDDIESTPNDTTDDIDLDDNANMPKMAENVDVSTLYSLSSDINESCDEFCKLKKEIANAIIETQNLITKIQNNEIELSLEQKLFLSEQSLQLRNLGKQLSTITTELSIHLSDLSRIMSTSGDSDEISLKYFLLLNNLINGNEMLQSSLNSLNMMNQMAYMRNSAPINNNGRVLYGFQKNNEPPIIKDYYIDNNGNLLENNSNTNTENKEDVNKNEDTSNEERKSISNVDSYNNNNLTSNIDTYRANQSNIDSFFNTALIDNEFMYGNGGYRGLGGYAGLGGYGYNNPYTNEYGMYHNENVNQNQPNTEKTPEKQSNNEINNAKPKKKFKLKKNIDTYRDENTPNVKTKISNIKQSVSNFFGGLNRPTDDNKIKNPIYRFETDSNNDSNSETR